ncbi:MAG: hypothetical protein JWQ87_3094 [Candidatus Sulfotelmatobacter sp.]|nr:hypothetical protein [Candidatus Sulfotelmatobacter sp.]
MIQSLSCSVILQYRPGFVGFPIAEARTAGSLASAAHRPPGCPARGNRGERLASMDASRPCLSFARSRRAHPPGSGNTRTFERGDHSALPARAAYGEFSAISGRLSDRTACRGRCARCLRILRRWPEMSQIEKGNPKAPFSQSIRRSGHVLMSLSVWMAPVAYGSMVRPCRN